MRGKRFLAALLALTLIVSIALSGCVSQKKGAGRKDTLASAGPSATPPAVTLAPSPTPAAPAVESQQPGGDAPASQSPAQPDPTPATPVSRDDYVPWGPNKIVEHIFFHPVIAYPQWAFHDCPSSRSEKEGLDDWMVTVDEYNKILRSIYDNDYVLVDINTVWSEYVDENGVAHMQRETLMLPPGKKPLIISFDDTNYYQYMLEQGFTSKLVIGDDGEIWAECTDPYTNETFLTQDLDAITILDKFVKEHPDFSPYGAKGCLSLTGYQGILGYRTADDDELTDPAAIAAFQANRQKEIEGVKPVIKRLKETGWTFGSHTWGHINLASWSMESIQYDSRRWANEVGSLVGETSILFYPHGARPDGNDVTETGPIFQYLHSLGFRVFASVGIESYSKIKQDISAVICDRLHPDGTTLRSGRSLKRYEQFYNAREIIDLDVRPDLGVTWDD